MGKLITLLGVLIVVAFFSGMSVAEFGSLLGSAIRSIFTFLGNVLGAFTGQSNAVG